MIEILTTAPLATVQDLGREGYRRFGVGATGAMDRLALAAANIMLGNAPGAAAIEVPASGFALRFEDDTQVALTGADCAATLDARPLPPWWTAPVRAGQILRLQMPTRGTNAYVAVAGGIAVPQLLGSRSTHLRGEFGGFEGRALRAGDRLPRGVDRTPAIAPKSFGIEPPDQALPFGEASSNGVTTLRVLPAAEYARFREEAQQALWSASWKISAQSNRAGYRLAGPDLILREPLEMRSHGLVPGVIQVPHGGQPIIQLADAYTAGGYPKIGTVIEADLWRIAQAPLGTALRFQRVTYVEAVDAYAATQAYLDRLSFWCELHRDARPRTAEPATRIHVDDLRTLLAWLEATSLPGLEIATASGMIRLTMEADRDGGLERVRIVASPSVGRFLGAHPHRASPFARAGQHVKVGDILALLAAGPIHQPILAPCDGIIVGSLAVDGALLGYGSPAMLIQPTAGA